jgi:hypothetical protein
MFRFWFKAFHEGIESLRALWRGEEQDLFGVEAILDKKVSLCGRNRKPVTFYLIRWKGVGPEHDEWVHKKNTIGAE